MGELVLVTGASGYIATHIVDQLLRAGYKVRATVRNTKDEKKIAPLNNLAAQTGYPENLKLVEADLLNEECWAKAAENCDYVLHTASPFPAENPKSEDELIKPAVNGTLNVLRACPASVKRVVLTSSIAAISAGHSAPPNGREFTEDDWTIPEKVTMVYEKSKTLAERAAWDYVEKSMGDNQRFELAVVNPSLVMGPALCGAVTTSLEIIKRVMQKEMPLLPKLNFPIIDVRDVAAAHIVAMTKPEAAGHRHILTCQNLWCKDMALMIEKEFKPLGYSIPTSYAPYGFLWLFGRFDSSVRMLLPDIGKEIKLNNSRMIEVLGINPCPIEETIIEMCHSMVQSGKVKKTAKYTAMHSKQEGSQ